jgi:hypothetical protein
MARRHPLHRHRGPSLAKPKERTLKRPEETLHRERFQIGNEGEIISEWWAISFRNHRRFEIGIMGDFARNQHRSDAKGYLLPDFCSGDTGISGLVEALPHSRTVSIAVAGGLSGKTLWEQCPGMAGDLLVFLRGENEHRAPRCGIVDGIVRGPVPSFIEADTDPG